MTRSLSDFEPYVLFWRSIHIIYQYLIARLDVFDAFNDDLSPGDIQDELGIWGPGMIIDRAIAQRDGSSILALAPGKVVVMEFGLMQDLAVFSGDHNDGTDLDRVVRVERMAGIDAASFFLVLQDVKGVLLHDKDSSQKIQNPEDSSSSLGLDFGPYPAFLIFDG